MSKCSALLQIPELYASQQPNGGRKLTKMCSVLYTQTHRLTHIHLFIHSFLLIPLHTHTLTLFKKKLRWNLKMSWHHKLILELTCPLASWVPDTELKSSGTHSNSFHSLIYLGIYPLCVWDMHCLHFRSARIPEITLEMTHHIQHPNLL